MKNLLIISVFIFSLFFVSCGDGSGSSKTMSQSSVSVSSSSIENIGNSCTFSEEGFEYCVDSFPEGECNVVNIGEVDNLLYNSLSCYDLGFSEKLQEVAYDADNMEYDVYIKELDSFSSSSASSLSSSSISSSSSSVSVSGVLKQQIIDENGATIDAGEIVLDIPAKTVDSLQNITITKDKSGDYLISGLQNELHKPITVSFATENIGDFNLSTTYVSFTSKDSCYAQSLRKVVDCFRYLDTYVEDNYLKAVIPTDISSKTVNRTLRTQERRGIVLHLRGGVRTYITQNGAFKIQLDKDDFDGQTESNITSIITKSADKLLQTDTLLHSMNFETDKLKKPTHIYIRTKESDRYLDGANGYAMGLLTSQFNTTVVISKENYESNKFDTTLAHEYFHAVQNSYYHDFHDYNVSLFNLKSRYATLMEASSVWIEYEIKDNPSTFNSPRVEGWKTFFIYGLNADFEHKQYLLRPSIDHVDDEADVGYGMALFFRYLSSKADKKIINDMWKEINAHKKPLVAMQNSHEKFFDKEKLSGGWLDFIKLYFNVQLPLTYPNDALWQTKAPVSLSIDLADHSSDKKIDFDMAELSAVLVDINNSSDKKLNYTMHIDTDSPLKIFKVQSDISKLKIIDVQKVYDYNISLGWGEKIDIAFVNQEGYTSLQFELDPMIARPYAVSVPSHEEACTAIDNNEDPNLGVVLKQADNYPIYYSISTDTCDSSGGGGLFDSFAPTLRQSCFNADIYKDNTLYENGTVFYMDTSVTKYITAIVVSPDGTTSAPMEYELSPYVLCCHNCFHN